MPAFGALPLPVNLALFTVAAAVVWLAATRIAGYASTCRLPWGARRSGECTAADRRVRDGQDAVNLDMVVLALVATGITAGDVPFLGLGASTAAIGLVSLRVVLRRGVDSLLVVPVYLGGLVLLYRLRP